MSPFVEIYSKIYMHTCTMRKRASYFFVAPSIIVEDYLKTYPSIRVCFSV